jgi:hypothetical protein
MSSVPLPAPLSPADYEMIEAAVMETEKGRWFLAEYARRHRSADTALVLDAIARVEGLVARGGSREPEGLRDAIDELKGIIEAGLAELDPGDTQAPDASSEILRTTEALQELCWTMRERGFEEAVCGTLDELTMRIYAACSDDERMIRRIEKAVRMLRFLEGRIDALLSPYAGDAAEQPGAGVERVQASERAPEPASDLPERQEAGTGRRFVGIEYIEQSLAELRNRAPSEDEAAEARPAPSAAPVDDAYQPAKDDPLARMTRRERYALFS